MALVAILLAAAGWWVSAGAGGDAERRHVSVDGVPLDEVHPEAGGRRPGVVVAHGFAGSARLMAQFGDTLAARGYVVVLLDFAGHGANTNPLPPDGDAGLQRDLDVAVAHLRGLPDVDPSRIALVGHSMGAGAVVRYGATHPEVGATVALSLPDASDVRPGRPQRLSVLVGAAEFAGFRDAAQRAADVGGGRAPVVVPFAEHVTILYSPRAHRVVVDRLDEAFGESSSAAVPSPGRRVGGAGLLLLAFALGFVPLTRALLGPARRDPADPGAANPGPANRDAAGSGVADRGPGGSSATGSARAARRLTVVAAIGRAIAVTAGAAVVAALLAAVAPTTRLPIAIGGFLVGFTTLTGAFLVAFTRLRAWANERAPGGAPDLPGEATPNRATAGLGRVRPVIAAVVLVVYAGAAIAVPLQVGVVQAVPVGPRWWLLALIWAGFAVLAFGAQALTGRSALGLLAVSAVATIVLTACAAAGLTSGFVLLVVPLLVVLMVWQAAWSGVLHAHAAPPWLVAPVGALLVAWPVAVTLPLTG